MTSTFPKGMADATTTAMNRAGECPRNDREDNGRQDRTDGCGLARPPPAAPPVCRRFQHPTWCPKPLLFQVLADQFGHVEHIHRRLAAKYRFEGRVRVDHPLVLLVLQP